MSASQNIRTQIQSILFEVNNTMNLLYYVTSIEKKNNLLYKLSNLMNQLIALINLTEVKETVPIPAPTQTAQLSQRLFTRNDLLKYNGKNGNPAYVTVNNIVYDVTNNSAWAAATHFGLSAGKDYSSQFASCHTGQHVLERLKIVGRLTDG